MAISIHAYAGFPAADGIPTRTSPALPQIGTLNVMGGPMSYLIEVRDEMPPSSW